MQLILNSTNKSTKIKDQKEDKEDKEEREVDNIWYYVINMYIWYKNIRYKLLKWKKIENISKTPWFFKQWWKMQIFFLNIFPWFNCFRLLSSFVQITFFPVLIYHMLLNFSDLFHWNIRLRNWKVWLLLSIWNKTAIFFWNPYLLIGNRFYLTFSFQILKIY